MGVRKNFLAIFRDEISMSKLFEVDAFNIFLDLLYPRP